MFLSPTSMKDKLVPLLPDTLDRTSGYKFLISTFSLDDASISVRFLFSPRKGESRGEKNAKSVQVNVDLLPVQ